MATNAPTPGTFLRPLGHYKYSYEVLAVFASNLEFGGLPRAQCRRWGLKDGLPFDDGHLSDDHGIDLRHRGADCWSSPSWYPDNHRYGAILWQSVPAPGGQLGLFS